MSVLDQCKSSVLDHFDLRHNYNIQIKGYLERSASMTILLSLSINIIAGHESCVFFFMWSVHMQINLDE